jgi:hypothetical protein
VIEVFHRFLLRIGSFISAFVKTKIAGWGFAFCAFASVVLHLYLIECEISTGGVVGLLTFGIACMTLRAYFDWRSLRRPSSDAFNLRAIVDEFCEQREVRARENPWLYCGLTCSVAGFVSIVYMTEGQAKEWFPLIHAAVFVFGSMIVAGVVAEREPLDESVETLIARLAGHAPRTQQAYEAFVMKLLDRGDPFTALREFAAIQKQISEVEERRRKAAAHYIASGNRIDLD